MKALDKINIRLNKLSTEKLTCITNNKGKTVSEVVREAIDHYYSFIFSDSAPNLKLIRDSGFIGAKSAEKDLSVKYKKVLKDILTKKYDNN